MKPQSEEKPPDVFADVFMINSNPMGAVLDFFARTPYNSITANGEGEIRGPIAQPVAHVRMTMEHAKMMCYVMWRHVVRQEDENKLRMEVPAEILKNNQIDEAQWRAFWYGESEAPADQGKAALGAGATATGTPSPAG